LDSLAALSEDTGLTHENPAGTGFMLEDGRAADHNASIVAIVAAAYF